MTTDSDTRALIKELGLVPADSFEAADLPAKNLGPEELIDILEKLGYSCKTYVEGYIFIYDSGRMVMLDYKYLPRLTFYYIFPFKDRREDLENVFSVLNDINLTWFMVKAFLDSKEENIVLNLVAVHEDTASFSRNAECYVEHIMNAAKTFEEQYDKCRLARMLAGFRNEAARAS